MSRSDVPMSDKALQWENEKSAGMASRNAPLFALSPQKSDGKYLA